MATPAQIAANRLNAQKSTGPRSDEGKAVSRFNALKHAATARSLIIPGEDEAALDELSAAYHEQFQPVGPEETLLVEKIIAADWAQRRMRRLEAQVFNTLIAQQDESEENPMGAAFIQDCKGPNALHQIFRRSEAASREWFRSSKDLRKLQAHRVVLAPPVRAAAPQPPTPRPQPPAPVPTTPAPGPQPQPAASAVPPPARARIGFVFDESTPQAWRL